MGPLLLPDAAMIVYRSIGDVVCLSAAVWMFECVGRQNRKVETKLEHQNVYTFGHSLDLTDTTPLVCRGEMASTAEHGHDGEQCEAVLCACVCHSSLHAL